MRLLVMFALLAGMNTAWADLLLPGEDDLIFKAKPKHVQKNIQWIIVEDLEQACFGKPKNPGDGELRGCAVFTPKTCVIYTKQITSLANLGHEMRHCYEGAWHK